MKNNGTIWFEQLDNEGKPTGYKRSFTPKVAERLLRAKDSKWRLIETEPPKAGRKIVPEITDEDKQKFNHIIGKMPKQTPHLIDWVKRQKDVKLLEFAKGSVQSQVVLDAITDRIKELTNKQNNV